ncbi:MAG: hypothetical protein Q9217_001494 [Psora testacea]
MPLDTSTYHLAHLRLDGRRWNELRRLHAQISTQPSADGSSYLEMGNTKVLCAVSGPAEVKGQGRREGAERDNAVVNVEVTIAGFAGVERKRRGRGDRRINEIQSVIASAMSTTLFLNLYPHSTISLNIHVLSLDGSLRAACLNAATLALIDSGISMKDYVCACTSGLSPPAPSHFTTGSDTQDPLLDLNNVEEQELPFLTVGTLGDGDRVVVLNMESRVQGGKLEGMLVTGVDGCRRIRGFLDGVVRERGAKVVAEGGGG